MSACGASAGRVGRGSRDRRALRAPAARARWLELAAVAHVTAVISDCLSSATRRGSWSDGARRRKARPRRRVRPRELAASLSSGGRCSRALPGAWIPAGRAGPRRCALGPGEDSAAVARALARVGGGGIAGAPGRRGACRLCSIASPSRRTDRGSRGRGARSRLALPEAMGRRAEAAVAEVYRASPRLRERQASRASPDDRPRRIPRPPADRAVARVGPGGARGAGRGIFPADGSALAADPSSRSSLRRAAWRKPAGACASSRSAMRRRVRAVWTRRRRDMGPARASALEMAERSLPEEIASCGGCRRGRPRRATPTNGGGDLRAVRKPPGDAAILRAAERREAGRIPIAARGLAEAAVTSAAWAACASDATGQAPAFSADAADGSCVPPAPPALASASGGPPGSPTRSSGSSREATDAGARGGGAAGAGDSQIGPTKRGSRSRRAWLRPAS